MELSVLATLIIVSIICIVTPGLRKAFAGFAGITALLVAVKFITCTIKAAIADPGATATGLPEFELSTWMIIGLLITAAIIVALHIVLSAALGALMRFRPIAEFVCLQAWAYAQRRKKGSVLRSVIEERIVAVGKNRLGLKRASSARGVINKIKGVEPARRRPNNVVPLRRRDEIRVPDAVNDVVRTVRRAA